MKYEHIFARAETSGDTDCFTRLAQDSPVDLYAGLDRGRRAIMLISRLQAPHIPPIAALAVDSRHRQDGRWVLVIALTRGELNALFSKLVEDLEDAASQSPEHDAVALAARLVRWQSLFARGSSELLTESQLRGLAAELEFLATEAIPALGPGSAVASWAGPYGGHKDFTTAEACVEVKALHPGQEFVTISSIEQLAPAGSPIYLWVKDVEGRFVEGSPGFSLADLVRSVRIALIGDAEAARLFEDGLLSAGYRDRPEYTRFSLRLGPARCFMVRDGFPRLLPPTPPDAVHSCRYELNVRHLEPFNATTWQRGRPDGSRS